MGDAGNAAADAEAVAADVAPGVDAFIGRAAADETQTALAWEGGHLRRGRWGQRGFFRKEHELKQKVVASVMLE